MKLSLAFTISLLAAVSNIINIIKHQFTVLMEKLGKKKLHGSDEWTIVKTPLLTYCNTALCSHEKTFVQVILFLVKTNAS